MRAFGMRLFCGCGIHGEFGEIGLDALDGGLGGLFVFCSEYFWVVEHGVLEEILSDFGELVLEERHIEVPHPIRDLCISFEAVDVAIVWQLCWIYIHGIGDAFFQEGL